MDEPVRTCPYCDAPLRVVRPAPPPHWGRFFCDACDTFTGIAPTPREELGGYLMPFGMFKGKTLAEIAKTDRGVGYLEWSSQNLTNQRIREVCGFYLEGLARQGAPTDRDGHAQKTPL